VFSPFQNDSAVSDPTTGNTNSFVVTSGSTITTINAGLVALSSVGNFVWNDANCDGIIDIGELGISGVSVALFFSNGTIYCNTTTNATGYYIFPNVVPGNYTAQFGLPAGYVFSPFQNANAVSDPTTGETNSFVVLSGSIITTINAAMHVPSTTGTTGTTGITGLTTKLVETTSTVQTGSTTNGKGNSKASSSKSSSKVLIIAIVAAIVGLCIIICVISLLVCLVRRKKGNKEKNNVELDDKEEPKKEEPKQEEPKKEETKDESKEESKKEEPKRDE